MADEPKLVDAEDRGDRAGFVDFINNFLAFLGTQGFIDVPAEPGFSVVPLAVYRTIGSPDLLAGEEN